MDIAVSSGGLRAVEHTRRTMAPPTGATAHTPAVLADHTTGATIIWIGLGVDAGTVAAQVSAWGASYALIRHTASTAADASVWRACGTGPIAASTPSWALIIASTAIAVIKREFDTGTTAAVSPCCCTVVKLH